MAEGDTIHFIKIERRDEDGRITDTGYGRDISEACCNSGFGDTPDDSTEVTEVYVTDKPGADDDFSEEICRAICDGHIVSDPDTPYFLKAWLQGLIEHRLYATAVHYCFHFVWDREYDDDWL